MPLPKPPSKKGDLLAAADFEAQAGPRSDKRALKTRPSAEATPAATLDLFEERAQAAANKPTAKAAPATPVAAPARPGTKPRHRRPVPPARRRLQRPAASRPRCARAGASRATVGRLSCSCWTPTC
jgi:PhoH-like ATPase